MDPNDQAPEDGPAANAGADGATISEPAGKLNFWSEHFGAALALVGVITSAITAAIVSFVGVQATNAQAEETVYQQYQADLILLALEPNDDEERQERFQFLIDSNLLTDDKIRDGVSSYLTKNGELPQFGNGSCHPSYSPCVPLVADVDCAGGSSDGPAYSGEVDVIAPDTYGLDPDGDGVACEGSDIGTAADTSSDDP